MKIRELLNLLENIENDFVFHGTSKKQYEKIQHNNYDVKDFYVGEDVDNICGYYAEKQSKLDGSTPVIITLSKNKLRNLKQDIHLDDVEQLGQFIFSGNIKDAIVEVNIGEE